MKDGMSGFDVLAIINELQPLVGSRVDKAYQPAAARLVLALNVPSVGRRQLHIVPGRWLFLHEPPAEMPAQPTTFARALRGRLENARLVGILHAGLERVVTFQFERGGRSDLIVELFGDGNLLIVEEGRILLALRRRRMRDREVRAGLPYVAPPPILDPLSVSAEEFQAALHRSKADLVRTLATRLTLGGELAEELLVRTGLEKERRASAVQLEEAGRLRGALAALVQQIREQPGPGILTTPEGRTPVPMRFQVFGGQPWEPTPTFSSAILQVLEEREVAQPPPEAQAAAEQRARLERQLAQQQKTIAEAQEEAERAKHIGDAIFANYQIAEARLALARTFAPGTDDPLVRGLDRRTGEFRTDLGGFEIVLSTKRSIEGSAERYYEAGKRARERVLGAQRAMEETRALLQAAALLPPPTPPKKAAVRRAKTLWFEQFRWFRSSEGALVLAGRDAQSNERLVKKHLQPGDRYAHADLHGASSVVVKMGPGIGPATLREACQFALCCSKAWAAGIGSGTAYWVLPEQVSKTAQSGEYIPKGAFVIRGKRNYEERLELTLAIGEVEIEGARRVMVGPPSAFAGQGRPVAILRPGATPKAVVAKRFAEQFGTTVEELQRLLPPGDVEVEEPR